MKLWFALLSLLPALSAPSFASVVASSPTDGATVVSPVSYNATGTTTTCATGVATMGIYVNHVLTYVQSGASLSTKLTLASGNYQTTVTAWDRCGGATNASVAITVANESATPTGLYVTSPVEGSTVSAPVAFVANSSVTTCAKGVAAMGIYVGSTLQYKVNGNAMNTTLPLAKGTQSATLKAWDYCNGSLSKLVSFVVAPTTTPPSIAFAANPGAPAAGSSSLLTWSTTNATSLSINQGIGSVASSGTQSVTPTQTTSYILTAVGPGGTSTKTVTVTVTQPTLTGVLMWKSNVKGFGGYRQETVLNPSNVNTTQFGKVRDLVLDGEVQGQPLYARAVDLGGTSGVHDLLILTTEHDSIYAFDGQSTSKTPLWKRSFLDATAGITVQPDNHGGRSTFGGEIGITSTSVIDPATGYLYVTSATQQNAVVTDTLHAIDIRTGADVVGTGVTVAASVPGTGVATVNGVVSFAASQQNQRVGLAIDHGVLYVPYGSFSDAPPYHGWLFAYDPATLKQLALFNASPNLRSNTDPGFGAAFWAGGAAPSFEEDGSFYLSAANGSTDVENGGTDYGDTLLHMKYSNGQFSVIDWFTPFNRDCIDFSDIEMGSGGFALLPESEVGDGRRLGVVITKEGRLYLLDRNSLGHFDATADQSVQMFMVGDHACDLTTTPAAADSSTWNRLYGNPSYWNGNLYMAASGQPIKQYAINGTTISTTPVATGADATYRRGGNTVVSSNGNTDGIVWEYQKTSDGNAMLHAFDATNVAKELWNSSMNRTRDGLVSGGQAFQTPVVIDGKVIAPSGPHVLVYQLLSTVPATK